VQFTVEVSVAAYKREQITNPHFLDFKVVHGHRLRYLPKARQKFLLPYSSISSKSVSVYPIVFKLNC